MFLRCSARKKDGKEQHYWSLVENRRVAEGRVVQRHVLYLGEINDDQQVAWRRSIEIFDQGEKVARTVALVAAERQIEQDSHATVRIRVDEMELRRPGRLLLGPELPFNGLQNMFCYWPRPALSSFDYLASAFGRKLG
jgi:hypothetical protein